MSFYEFINLLLIIKRSANHYGGQCPTPYVIHVVPMSVFAES
jgi:hypothetical protein